MNWTDRSAVYPAFIQAHLASRLHGSSDRCKNDCPANGLAIKVLNLQRWGEAKTDLHSGARNERRERERGKRGDKTRGIRNFMSGHCLAGCAFQAPRRSTLYGV